MLSLEDWRGEMKVPVVFVNFEKPNGDNEFVISASNKAEWLKRLNDSNSASHLRENGSVNDYFAAQSYGQFQLTFDSIGTYTAAGAAKDWQDYNDCARMVEQAVAALDGSVDWGRYDKNGDGEVDCLLFIYAGHCDDDLNRNGAAMSSIYPHHNWLESALGHKARMADGHSAQGYVFVNDLRDRNITLAATNTACHELSHGVLDLCDYYKNGYSYMGQYDAMCYGYRQRSYGSANDHCCDLSSVNRMLVGWLEPQVLTETCHVTLRPLSKYADACAVIDPADANHFYLLENRQALKDTWDAALPAGGLVVTEVRWNKRTFQSHTVNSGRNKNVQLLNAETGRGLEIPQSSYLDVSQKGVPYGPDGRDVIDGTVSGTFAMQNIRNIIQLEDGSMEFDYVNEASGVENVRKQSDDRCYDLAGRVVQPRTGMLFIQGGKLRIGR